jgi:hypothetical protein
VVGFRLVRRARRLPRHDAVAVERAHPVEQVLRAVASAPVDRVVAFVRAEQLRAIAELRVVVAERVWIAIVKDVRGSESNCEHDSRKM